MQLWDLHQSRLAQWKACLGLDQMGRDQAAQHVDGLLWQCLCLQAFRAAAVMQCLLCP